MTSSRPSRTSARWAPPTGRRGGPTTRRTDPPAHASLDPHRRAALLRDVNRHHHVATVNVRRSYSPDGNGDANACRSSRYDRIWDGRYSVASAPSKGDGSRNTSNPSGSSGSLTSAPGGCTTRHERL